MDNILVVKRAGNTEPWSKDKIINSVVKAGLSMREAEALSVIAEEWAKKSASEGKVMSAEIRDKLIEILKVIDPLVADAYEVYKK